jgi:hypothetical protein
LGISDIDPKGMMVIFAKKQEKTWKQKISKRNNFKKLEKANTLVSLKCVLAIKMLRF